jgi:tetraacyldisaccharide 4'-kinase
VPVIVVGNVVAGGAGKTPSSSPSWSTSGARLRAGVVSRGYGRQALAASRSRPPAIRARSATSRCWWRGVAACRWSSRRPAAGRAHPAGRASDVQVIVSDDGLQHHALQRDIEVVVFDDRGIGNGWLLPAGPLREPWPRPADLVVRSAGAAGIAGFRIERHLAAHARRADGTRGRCGRTCRPRLRMPWPASPARGLLLHAARRRHHARARHRAARPPRFRRVPMPGPPADMPLLCTEKDAVKLWRTHPRPGPCRST